MKTIKNIGLENVQAVYSGPEGDLWELVMGEQIHIGGFQSSMDLAKRAGIGAGMQGVDLCCCSGAGMRFLVKFCGVASMRGVDATAKVVERGRQRCQAAGAGQANQLHPRQCLRQRAAFGQRRLRVGRGRLVLRGGQAEADRRSGAAGEAGRADCLHRLDRGAGRVVRSRRRSGS